MTISLNHARLLDQVTAPPSLLEHLRDREVFEIVDAATEFVGHYFHDDFASPLHGVLNDLADLTTVDHTRYDEEATVPVSRKTLADWEDRLSEFVRIGQELELQEARGHLADVIR